MSGGWRGGWVHQWVTNQNGLPQWKGRARVQAVMALATAAPCPVSTPERMAAFRGSLRTAVVCRRSRVYLFSTFARTAVQQRHVGHRL